MASDPASIANMALDRVGTPMAITSLEDNSVEAGVCNRFYDHARKAVLRDFGWPFADVYATLDLVANSPNNDWYYSYGYPSDCIRALRIVTSMGMDETSPPPFRIGKGDSGRLVYTNQPEAVLLYTVDEDDTTVFDDDFVDAFAWRLAWSIAPALRVGDKVKNDCRDDYRASISAAQKSALNEGQIHRAPAAEHIRARNGLTENDPWALWDLNHG